MDPIVDLSERRPLRRVWLIVSAWAIVALVQAITLHFSLPLRFDYALLDSVMNYSIMALLVWASCLLNVRLRLWSRRPLHALAAYLGLGAAGIAIWCAIELLAMRAWVGPVLLEHRLCRHVAVSTACRSVHVWGRIWDRVGRADVRPGTREPGAPGTARSGGPCRRDRSDQRAASTAFPAELPQLDPRAGGRRTRGGAANDRPALVASAHRLRRPRRAVHPARARAPHGARLPRGRADSLRRSSAVHCRCRFHRRRSARAATLAAAAGGERCETRHRAECRAGHAAACRRRSPADACRFASRTR